MFGSMILSSQRLIQAGIQQSFYIHPKFCCSAIVNCIARWQSKP